jgi:hypothetical protein|nr:MAG TPA: hypothetical protein [Caudoviricetes sp.]
MMKNLSHDIGLKNFLAILDPNVNPEHCRIGQTETEIITVRKEVRKHGYF